MLGVWLADFSIPTHVAGSFNNHPGSKAKEEEYT